MPVKEKFLGRSGSTGTDAYAQITFFADEYDNADGPTGAIAAVLNSTVCPSSWGGLKREKVSDFHEVAHRCWEVTVHYANTQLGGGQVGDSSFSFKTSGGTAHITQSLENKHGYHLNIIDGTTSDLNLYRGAIGVTNDSVEGCDIRVAVYEFEETHYIAADKITNAYKALLLKLTGTTNDIDFKGLVKGEGLFLGADGLKQGDEMWKVTFYFAGSANRTGLRVGDITGIEKKGWEYLWVRYVEEVNETKKKLVRRPEFVGIEKVYYDAADAGASWAQLNIGT